MVAPRPCGLAISANALVAVAVDGNAAPWRRALRPLDGASWAGLAQALREGVEAGVVSSPVRLALLPSLVEVRTVSIPPVGDDDARRLLTRAASRHFVSAREPMDVSVAASPSGTTRLAAAVPARVLRAVLEAAREAQLQVEVVVPAQVALTTAARGPRATRRAVLAGFDEAFELLVADQGTLADVRRFRRTGDDNAMADAARSLGEVTRVEDPMTASATAMATTAIERWPLAFTGASPQSIGGSGGATSWWLFGAAALLALATVALQEIDVRRELATVQTERAGLAPQLAASGAPDADRQARLDAQLAAPRWSGILAAVSDALPAEAYVTHVRAQADSVIIEGNASRATTAFDALSAVPWVRTITASAPIRRETADDGTVTEKFEFTLTLRAP